MYTYINTWHLLWVFAKKKKKKLKATNLVHHSTYFVMIKYLKSPSLLEPIHKTTKYPFPSTDLKLLLLEISLISPNSAIWTKWAQAGYHPQEGKEIISLLANSISGSLRALQLHK